jgi:phosphoribosyl 1,2-cyclic phosphodiesterase
MKNAILVSSDTRWRAVTEATLLERGWKVAATEVLGGEACLDPAQVQAVWVDVESMGREAVSRWMGSKEFPGKIPVILAPGFEGAESLARTLEWPEGEGARAGVEKREGAVRLRLWGVRGSIPTPGPSTVWYGGNTSCVELKAAGETVILDAGSGLRNLGEKLIEEAGGQPLRLHMLLSHTHWDHIQGFPFFRPAYQPANHIRLMGYSGVRHNLDRILDVQMEDEYFPVQMADMLSELEVLHVSETFQCGALTGHCFMTNHPGKCSGFRFDTSVGPILYVPDNELNRSGQATHMPRETAQHLRERFVETVAGARVLIHDAQYTRAEYANRVGWGHSAVEDTVELAGEAGVERLILFHHDPLRTDEAVNRLVVMARELVRERGWTMRVDAAREGMEIVL